MKDYQQSRKPIDKWKEIKMYNWDDPINDALNKPDIVP